MTDGDAPEGLECWRGDAPEHLPGRAALLWRIRRIEKRQWHMATAQVLTLAGVLATLVSALAG